MSISKDEFFEFIEQPLPERVIKHAGKEYRLRAMTEEAGIDYEIELSSGGKWDIKKTRRAMIAAMLIDDNGDRICESESQLKKMPRALAGVLYAACLELNSYEQEEIEDLIKNSEPVESYA